MTGSTTAPAWFVEFDKAPSKVLTHHWPDVPNYGDVTTVDWSTVPPVDIITVPAQCAAALRAFLWDAYGIGAAA